MTSEPRRARRARTPSGRHLVIVESPAKARTIASFLGPEYIVESSIGHVRDLPSKAAEIPADVKREPWARLGVDVDHGFAPLYVVPASKQPQVTKLRALLKDVDSLYLATDEDREGEAIAWHLQEVLKPRVPVHRMVFHEITRQAIAEAISRPREIDEHLVQAQEARRILDRLYGYEVSPVLWRKVRPRLSAGRVQSAAIRMIVARERLRMRFVAAGYWDVDTTLAVREADATPGAPATVGARLVELGGQRVASGRDFDASTGQLTAGDTDARIVLLDEARARAVAAALAATAANVVEVTERPFTQRPAPPFITSTLQQEAARKLRYTAQRTMSVAQQLYENGFITYMRTDSTNLSDEALNAARTQVRELYGPEYVPAQPRRFTGRVRGAQEAHEAIRPAGEAFQRPEQVRGRVDSDAYRLYELIWMRTMASQMPDASGLRTAVRMAAALLGEGDAVLAASGRVITFPGFLRAYVEGSDDPDAELEEQERVLPPLRSGQPLDVQAAEPRGHETQPPARYTEASLIRELEERGIGRPSTYASILGTIQDRGYARKRGSALVPMFVAFAVVNLLEQHFPELVDLDFTARMEDDLDRVADGALEATPWLRRFYFGDPDAPAHPDDGLATDGLKARIGAGWEAIDAREVSSIPLGTDERGRVVAVRVGRYGPYIQAGDDEPRASLPEDTPPDEIDLAGAIALLEQAERGDQVLGTDAASGLPVYFKVGRYGPYVQLGEDDTNEGKPRRASLWPGMEAETLTLEEAQTLLSFPRTLGAHPTTGEPVTVQDGPLGPYVKAGKETRSLRDHEHLRAIEFDEAVALLAEPRQQRGRRAAPSALAELGPHPDSGKPVTVRSGRFGPYVTDGAVNATIPAGRDPQQIDLDEALDLLALRAARLREQGRDPAAPRTPRRATAPRNGTRATPRARTARAATRRSA
ncbi:MAG: type I DNA topoisomerase [Dehalococcoidia bacterium]|nr:type I DNA topoisomerase [Dehalococcoidia bacterium]